MENPITANWPTILQSIALAGLDFGIIPDYSRARSRSRQYIGATRRGLRQICGSAPVYSVRNAMPSGGGLSTSAVM